MHFQPHVCRDLGRLLEYRVQQWIISSEKSEMMALSLNEIASASRQFTCSSYRKSPRVDKLLF